MAALYRNLLQCAFFITKNIIHIINKKQKNNNKLFISEVFVSKKTAVFK